MKKQKAFTLIELLVVISVLGVLFAILLPNMIGMRLRARDTQAKSDLRQIKAALRLYYNDYQIYPDNDESGGIVGCGSDSSLSCPNSDGSFAVGDIVYMKELPDSGDYHYTQLEFGDDFELYKVLENASDADILESVEHCNITAPVDGAFYLCAD